MRIRRLRWMLAQEILIRKKKVKYFSNNDQRSDLLM